MTWKVLVDWDGDGCFYLPPVGNQVSNGDFASDVTGWTPDADVTCSWAGGKMYTQSSVPADIGSVYQALDYNVCPGDTFHISIKLNNLDVVQRTIALTICSAASDTGRLYEEHVLPATSGEITYTTSGSVTAGWTDTVFKIIHLTAENDNIVVDDVVVQITHAVDNITEYVLGDLRWTAGCRAFQRMGDEASVDVVVDNQDKRFSPELTTGPYYGKLTPNIPVSIRFGRSGNGAVGEYYNNYLGGWYLVGYPVLTRVDNTIDFSWGSGSPDASIDSDNFEVRWTGFITPDYSEEYTFYVNVSMACRLYIGDVLVVDNWSSPNSTASEETGTIHLIADVAYPFKLEYYDTTSTDATCELRWSSASEAKAVIPNGSLTPGDYDMWQGYMNDIVPEPLLYGRRTSTIKCIGRKEQLQRSYVLRPYRVGYSVNQLLDDLLTALFPGYDEGGIRYAFETNVGHCYDNFMVELSRRPEALYVLRTLIDLEWGKLFWGKGRWEFWPRYFLYNRSTTEDLDVQDTMADLEYTTGQQDIVNEALVTVYPRVADTDVTEMFRMDTGNEPMVFPYGEYKTYTLFLMDGFQGGLSGPVCVVDGGLSIDSYVVDSLGYHPSGSMYQSFEDRGQYAEWTIGNFLYDYYAYTELLLDGPALRVTGAITHIEQDDDSITAYGLRPFDVDLPLGDREGQASGLAEWLVGRFSEPSPRVETVSFRTESDGTENADQLDYGIGNTLRLRDTQTAHDRDYMIVGETHLVNIQDQSHETTWNLEPIDDLRGVFVLDDTTYGTLDNDNRLGF